MREIAPWVLLRGLTRDSRHWCGLPAQLEARLPGQRVVCLDLPGNGRLVADRSPLDIGAYVAACREALAQANVAGPYNLLALSLGGLVALEWARRYPGEIASCVLLNISLRASGPWHWRLRPAVLMSLLRTMLTRDAFARERAIVAATSRRYRPGTPVGDALVREWATLYRTAPVTRANAIRQLLAAARYRCDAPPPVPLLLLGSTRDALVDVRCARVIAGAWGCRLIEHPDAGHDLPLDDPDWVVAQAVGDPASGRARTTASASST